MGDKPIIKHCRNCKYHKSASKFDIWCDVKYKWRENGRISALFCRFYKMKAGVKNE